MLTGACRCTLHLVALAVLAALTGCDGGQELRVVTTPGAPPPPDAAFRTLPSRADGAAAHAGVA